MVTHMIPRDMQENNEILFSKKHISPLIREFLLSETAIQEKIKLGITLLRHYREQEYYESKNLRIAQLCGIDMEELVIKIFVSTVYYQRPETLVSATAMVAHFLGFGDKRDSILTVAEIMAVLAETDVYDIWRNDRTESFMVQSNIVVPEDLVQRVNRCMYLPPMVCAPNKLRNNFESAYLTFNDNVILGKNNDCTGDACLDVINLQNNIPLKLDTEFLCKVEEEPNPGKVFETADQQKAWEDFKLDSYATYELIVGQGNRFYLPNRLDKRGRSYAQGYYITTQGSSFKKAMIEFANEEVVEGVPESARISNSEECAA